MGKYTRPDYTSQSESTWRANADNADAMNERGAGKYFNPQQQDSADMTIRLQAGEIFSDGSRLEVAAQNTGTITAPTANSRIDLVVVDQSTGGATIVTGTSATAPTAPAIPTGKFPVALVTTYSTSTSIIDTMIEDIRGPFFIAPDPGTGLAWSDAINSSLVPDTDSAYNLGDGTHYFATAYIDDITTTGDITCGGNLSGSALTLTGNIAVGGTVDGRDIATDGTKLDGIEAAADVTDFTNVKSALDNGALTSTACATGDLVLIQDVSDTNALKRVTAQSIADLASGGGGQWTYVSTTTISSATAAMEFTGLTASAYMLQIVHIQGASDAVSVKMTASNDNGSSYASVDYQYSAHYEDSGLTKDTNFSAGWLPILNLGVGTATGEYGASIEVTLMNTSDASRPLFARYHGSTMSAVSGALYSYIGYGVTADDANGGSTLGVNAVKVEMSAGNIATAVVHLYKLVTS